MCHLPSILWKKNADGRLHVHRHLLQLPARIELALALQELRLGYLRTQPLPVGNSQHRPLLPLMQPLISAYPPSRWIGSTEPRPASRFPMPGSSCFPMLCTVFHEFWSRCRSYVHLSEPLLWTDGNDLGARADRDGATVPTEA